MSNPPIPKINADNEIIGETTIAEAVKNGWPRRVVRIFVFDEEGKILIQKRSATITGYPGYWDQAAGGHIDVGEEPSQAAWREAKEEIGLDLSLTEILTAHYTSTRENSAFNYVYRAIVQVGIEVNIDPDEVGEVCWLSVSELDESINTETRVFVPGFVDIWSNFRDKLLAP